MSSFIDLMGDDVWSDADIANRVDTMVTSSFPDRHILERDELFVKGGHGGPPDGEVDFRKPDEKVRFDAYVQKSKDMRALFEEAKADMDLLREAMAVEDAYNALKEIPLDDAEARAPYIEIIENASQEARDLAAMRIAEHEPEPPTEPEPKDGEVQP